MTHVLLVCFFGGLCTHLKKSGCLILLIHHCPKTPFLLGGTHDCPKDVSYSCQKQTELCNTLETSEKLAVKYVACSVLIQFERGGLERKYSG